VFSGIATPISSAVTVVISSLLEGSAAGPVVLGTVVSTPGSGTFSFTAPNLADGSYLITVTSPAGTSNYNLIIDTVVPPIPTLDSVNGQAPGEFTTSGTSILTFVGTARAGDTVTILANNETVGSNVTAPDNRFIVLSKSVDDGRYRYELRAESPAGAPSAPVLVSESVEIVKPTASANQGCLLMDER
jgi:hypothetical protein